MYQGQILFGVGKPSLVRAIKHLLALEAHTLCISSANGRFRVTVATVYRLSHGALSSFFWLGMLLYASNSSVDVNSSVSGLGLLSSIVCISKPPTSPTHKSVLAVIGDVGISHRPQNL